MDNGLSSLVAGKRRRDGYANDEDVKDVKASRQWYGSQRGDKDQGQQQQQQLSNGHYQGVSVENHIRMQQQKQLLSEATPTTPGVPSLNMEQRVMAAAALQDLRGITESSKAYFQSQMQQQQQQQQQQHTKYGVVQQQALPQLLNSDTTTLGESSSTVQPPQTGSLPLPPLPYIRTPPLHSEADTHNGSPSSSSSGPYPSLPNTMPASQYGLSHRSNAPIQQQQQPPPQQQQLPELETESSYSSLMHPSQSKLLAQSQSGITQHLQQQQQQQQQPDRESIMHSSGLVVSYQRDEFPHGQVVQSSGLPQNGNVHQLSGHPSRNLVQNGAAFHHGGHALPANTFQNGSQNGMQNLMQNGLQNGIQNGMQNGIQNGIQNGMQGGSIQQPGGQVLSNGNQLPQGDSQRLVGNVLHQQGRNPMASSSSSHHQPGVQHSSQMGLPNGVMHQQGVHRMQESMVQYQSGPMAPQQPGHCSSSNGAAAAAAHPSVQGCSSSFQHQEAGFSPLHGDFHVKSLIVPNYDCNFIVMARSSILPAPSCCSNQ